MAHFAKLNEHNIVEHVSVVSDIHTCNEKGIEDENVGIEYLKKLYGTASRWKKTSYNGRIRKNYAGIGYIYDEQRDAFIPPKPFNSWVLNEDTCLWEATIPPPGDLYIWDEKNQFWVEMTENVDIKPYMDQVIATPVVEDPCK